MCVRARLFRALHLISSQRFPNPKLAFRELHEEPFMPPLEFCFRIAEGVTRRAPREDPDNAGLRWGGPLGEATEELYKDPLPSLII